VEREIFGTTDAYVASKVLHSWHLPAMVCEGIAFHQEPDLAPPEYRIIAGLTQFACCIAQTCGIGSSGDGLKTEFPATFLGQNPNLRFSHKTVQDSLVKEVLNSMEKIVAEATATPQKSQSRKSNLKQKNEKKSAPGTASAKKSQKGMFGWVRSLWNGG
jgi:hypothetical protein